MSQPLYRVVFNTIIQRIVNGIYPPGSMLPSEFDLGSELGVSQGTARKALIELDHKGIIERRQGRGTFVTLRTPESSLFHFFRLRDAKGQQVVPKLDDEVVSRRRATEAEKSALFGAPNEVYEIVRTRSYQGRPLSYETCVVSVMLFPGLQERAPLPNTLYVLFQQAYSCIIISADESLKASVLGDEISTRTAMDPAKPVIVARRQGYDLLERVVELRTSIFITDTVTYSVKMD